MIIKWNDTFHVNIDHVDNQHRNLVGLVNNLAEAMANAKGKDVLAAIIDDLVSYTQEHFQAEERIMELVNYPELTMHQSEHAAFIEKVTDFQIKFDRGQLGLTIEVMNFLCDWVRNHIKKSDKKYAEFIGENGLPS